MRVAAIYDVHGNLPALEAVLAEIREAEVDQVVVGGDVIPGSMPRETISTLTDLEVPVHFIHGNGETEILAMIGGSEPSAAVPEQFHEAMRWVAQDLLPEQARLLNEWPLTFRLDLPEIGQVIFCHATPRSDTEIFTRATPQERLVSIFEAAGAPLIICGHTHAV